MESYFNGTLSKDELPSNAAGLRKQHRLLQKQNRIDFISSNDFSYSDTFLDMAFLLNVIRLKTRGMEETTASLKNMAAAAKELRP